MLHWRLPLGHLMEERTQYRMLEEIPPKQFKETRIQ